MGPLSFTRSIISPLKCYLRSRKSITIPVRGLMSRQLVYSEFGDPVKVVKYREVSVPALQPQEVLVRMLAAPVNPADINTIQGKYPVKVELPCIPGNEGVGIVEDVGKEVTGISLGNKVIVTKPVQGTWRNIGTFNKETLMVVPENLGLVEAATLTVNPSTAYRMLTDFKPIQDGLVVIQNGGNSACGQNVIQLCKAWNVKNINIVRNRPDIDELKKYLECLGATYVLTEEELRSTTIFKDKCIDKPSLALNCVGGKSSLEMLRHLQHSGKMVTYGGMSREPVNIPTSAFIFKNLSFYGFWMTAWNQKASQQEKDKMMAELITLMCENKLRRPIHKMVKFNNYEEALKNALTSQGFTGCRYPSLPCLPTVAGDEGVGDIVEIGDMVSRFRVKQRVIMSTRQLGTWRYYGIFHERDLHPISPNIPLADAAMLSIAPCTAWKLLHDFIKLQPLQCVIQNAANSPVGQCVIQICKALDIHTFNIVASRCGYQHVKEHLKSLGANEVVTLDEAECTPCYPTSVSRPLLGLNCLGGRFEDVMVRMLERGGAMVYYGCAYDMPPERICNRCDITYHRFNLNEWDKCATALQRDLLLKNIVELIVSGKLRAPVHDTMELRNYMQALQFTAPCEAYAVSNILFDFTV